MRLIVLLPTIGAMAWLLVAGAERAASTQPSGCAATAVRYQPAKHPTLTDAPWALAKPAAAGVVAYLVSYPQTLRDGRVNRSDGLVLWATGEKIVWNAPGRSSRNTTVIAHRLDGRESIRLRLSARAQGLVATPRFPAPGCWRLAFRRGATEASVVASVVARPSAPACDATPIEQSLAVTRPRSAGIAGGWTWQSSDGTALMYTHGVGPDDLNAKVMWWIRRNWGGSLKLTGIRLDGKGVFRQEFHQAGEPSRLAPGYRAVFPSIIDVPSAGCWLFRLRSARLAGVLVVRAIDR